MCRRGTVQYVAEEPMTPHARDAIVHDITLALDEDVLLYPGDSPPHVRRLCSLEDGATVTASEFSMQCHVGTHVDAPAHFILGGKNVSDYPIAAFLGPAMVVNVSDARVVTATELRGQGIPRNQHVLLKTQNSKRLGERKFDADHVYLARDAAEYLLSLNPLSVGFDYYSVDQSGGAELPIHRLFAKEQLLVYVCLDLRSVPAGAYTFCGLPLRLQNVEGSPVRAILIPTGT